MRVGLSTPARLEFLEAVGFYGNQSVALSSDLVQEFEGAIAQITSHPEAGAPFEHGTRRVLLRRFPFAVIYRLKPGQAEVIAFAHQRMRPGYWADRR